MVGFVIGLLVGAVLGFTLMACLKVGGDDLEQYYIDLIQTYDKKVNRQYKIIKKAIDYINTMPLTKGTEWYRIQLLDILYDEEKTNDN